MTLFTRSTGTGMRACLAVAGMLWLLGSVAGNAETLKMINGAPIDSAVLDAYIANRINKPLAQVTPEERQAMMAELTDIYLLSTQDSAKELEKAPAVQAQIELQKRGVLAQAAAEQFLSTINVGEEEILAEYQKQVEMAPPLQFKARHILVPTQGAATDIIHRLDEGADFVELAKEKSTGPAGPNGGDLGWFSPDQMVKPFSDAVANLKDGAYTKDPVQTKYGWHVILREASRKMEPPTLDGVRDVVTQKIQQRKFQEHIQQLRDAANAGQEPSQ